MELDPYDVNDIIRALKNINFDKYIILEDFHYLPIDTQKDFSFALKAFHEKSKYCFMIVGVWREENRLISYNGDLTNRVISIDVDGWKSQDLTRAIEAGGQLLNVQFDAEFVKELLDECSSSIHIVQEVCLRCCQSDGIYTTMPNLQVVGIGKDAKSLVRAVVNEQKARYQGFLLKFADGFQATDLEMYKWILYPVLTSSTDRIADGLGLTFLSRMIKEVHPRGETLNNGNITQALLSSASLQVKKEIRPIVMDYDSTSLSLNIVDRGFIVWLASQNVNELLDFVDLPRSKEKEEEKGSAIPK